MPEQLSCAITGVLREICWFVECIGITVSLRLADGGVVTWKLAASDAAISALDLPSRASVKMAWCTVFARAASWASVHGVPCGCITKHAATAGPIEEA